MDSIIFTDYYFAQLLTDAKSRFDVIKKYGGYPPFETSLLNKTKFNVGGLSFNYGKYTYGKANYKRLPQMSISRGKHISGVFVPNLENNLIAYGDVQGTNDAIILLFNDTYTQIEILVARGKINDSIFLYNEVLAGEYNTEIEILRAKAIDVFTKSVTNLVTLKKAM